MFWKCKTGMLILWLSNILSSVQNALVPHLYCFKKSNRTPTDIFVESAIWSNLNYIKRTKLVIFTWLVYSDQTQETHTQTGTILLLFFVLMMSRVASKGNKRKLSALRFLSQCNIAPNLFSAVEIQRPPFIMKWWRDERQHQWVPITSKKECILFTQWPFIIVRFCVTLRSHL